MGNFRNIIVAFLWVLLPLVVNSQYSKKEARKAFDEGNYHLALEIFNNIPGIEEDKKGITYRAISNYHANNLDQALKDLSQAKNMGNDDDDMLIYAAKIYQHKGNYDQAIAFYRQFLKTLGKRDTDVKQLVIENIKSCAYALQHQNDELNGIVENFGDKVNSQKNELYPLISPNHPNLVYFSSNLTLDYDVYQAKLLSKTWVRSLNFESKVNSDINEIAHSFSPSGEAMFFERGGHLNNNLYYNFSGSNHGDKLMSENFLEIDTDFYFPDNNTVIFSSIRKDGYGGYDLYMSKFIKKNWSTPENLGPVINSSFDERSPFITPDGKRLFFSCNKSGGFGSYDIYQSKNSPEWLRPENMGHPINSVGDDLFFKISDAGHMAVMSSNRKSGYGGYDIYQVFLKDKVQIDRTNDKKLSFILEPYHKKTIDTTQFDEEKVDPIVLNEPRETVEDKKSTAVTQPIKKTIQPEDLVDKKGHDKKNEEIVKNSIEAPKDNPIAETKMEEKTLDEPIVKNQVKIKEVQDKTTNPNKDLVKKELSIQKKETTKVISKPHTKVVLDHLYFDNPDNLLTSDNEKQLKKILKLLTDYPQSKVVLTAHTHNKGLIEFQLYRSVRHAEKMASYLEMNYISRDRILVKSVGSSYPKVKRNADPDLKHYNQKIAVAFYGLPENVDFELTPPVIDKLHRDNSYDIYQTIVDEIYYRVEITRQDKMFKNYLLRNYADLLVEKPSIEDELIYYIGLYPNYQDALQLKNDLSKTNLPYSRIVAFFNGKRLDDLEAKEMAADYPNLNDFVQAQDD